MRRLVLFAVIATLSLAGTASATYPGRDGAIALGTRGNDPDALRLFAPGSRTFTNLFTCQACFPDGENFSASGRHVVFDLDGTIAEVAIDGTGERTLPGQAATAPNEDPAYSPHGTFVAVTGHADRGPHSDLYVLRPGMGTTRRLTFRGGRWPAWSSTNRIAFTRGARCPSLSDSGADPGCVGGALYTVRPDGTGLRRLTHDDAEAPDWSPRGRLLAFVRRGDIYTIHADGSGLRRLVPGEHIRSVVWAPDGRRLLFWRDGSALSVAASGGPLRRVVSSNVADPEQGDAGFDVAKHPAWRPVP